METIEEQRQLLASLKRDAYRWHKILISAKATAAADDHPYALADLQHARSAFSCYVRESLREYNNLLAELAELEG